jgi:hypothetical protein
LWQEAQWEILRIKANDEKAYAGEAESSKY